MDEIRMNGFDLSVGRYKETIHEGQDYDPPQVILSRMKALNAEIDSDLIELEGMLK
jgi:type I restriction enzyme M protein